MWVIRLTGTMVAWVFMSVLPASRTEMGIAAISGLRGMPPRLAR